MTVPSKPLLAQWLPGLLEIVAATIVTTYYYLASENR
jgi:hypothetical protein